MNRSIDRIVSSHRETVVATIILLATTAAWSQPPAAAIPTASSAIKIPASADPTSATRENAPQIQPSPAPTTGTPTQAWQPNVSRSPATPRRPPQTQAALPELSPSPTMPLTPAPSLPPPGRSMSTAPLPSPVPEGLPVESRRQLLYFRIPQSRDCLRFENSVLGDPTVKKAMAMLSMEQINMNSGDSRIGRLRIMRVPSFVIMRPDGTEVARHVGAITRDEFLALLTK